MISSIMNGAIIHATSSCNYVDLGDSRVAFCWYAAGLLGPLTACRSEGLCKDAPSLKLHEKCSPSCLIPTYIYFQSPLRTVVITLSDLFEHHEPCLLGAQSFSAQHEDSTPRGAFQARLKAVDCHIGQSPYPSPRLSFTSSDPCFILGFSTWWGNRFTSFCGSSGARDQL